MARERQRTGDYSWGEDLPLPEVMSAALCNVFGENYEGEYGWAAELTAQHLNVEKPRWWHLTKIANIDEYQRSIQDAHHSVHGGDAYGLLGTINDATGLFHAGASAEGVLPAALDSVRLFRETMWALFDNCVEYSGGVRKAHVLQSLFDAHALTRSIELGQSMMSVYPSVRENFSDAMKNSFMARSESSSK